MLTTTRVSPTAVASGSAGVRILLFFTAWSFLLYVSMYFVVGFAAGISLDAARAVRGGPLGKLLAGLAVFFLTLKVGTIAATVASAWWAWRFSRV